MDEEQEKFWKILSEPYDKNCYNCSVKNLETDTICKFFTRCKYSVVGSFDTRQQSRWKWDEK